MSIAQPPLILWQFTDTHLAADPAATLMGVNTLDSLRRVVAAACVDAPRPRAVIATGDLIHDDSAAAYRLLAATLAPLAAPVLCLPGNHDDAALMRELLGAGAVRYAEHWLAGRWQVILLNSAQPGQAAGRLPAAELARLQACLARYPEHFALLCVHHPPLAIGSPWMDAMGLVNGAELLELAAARPRVRGIVWGHIHQEYEAEWRGLRLFGTPSTCVQFTPGAERCTLDPRPPAYRWLQLHGDGRIDSGVRRVAL